MMRRTDVLVEVEGTFDAAAAQTLHSAFLGGTSEVTMKASRAVLPKDPSTRIIFYCRGAG